MLKRRSVIAAVTAAMMATPAIAFAQAESAGVSPMMAGMVQDFVFLSLQREVADTPDSTEEYADLSKRRTAALKALAFHPPANLIELSAKLSALVEFTDDTERYALRMTAEDALRLAGTR